MGPGPIEALKDQISVESLSNPYIKLYRSGRDKMILLSSLYTKWFSDVSLLIPPQLSAPGQLPILASTVFCGAFIVTRLLFACSIGLGEPVWAW